MLSFGLDGDDHDATGIFYGRLVEDPEVLARMDHEVYGTFARLDSGPPPEQVATFETALRTAGIENDLHIYDAVNHGFWLHVDGETRTCAAVPPSTHGSASKRIWIVRWMTEASVRTAAPLNRWTAHVFEPIDRPG